MNEEAINEMLEKLGSLMVNSNIGNNFDMLLYACAGQ
jgi:hypothetical protein